MNAITIDVKTIPAPVMQAHCRGLLASIGNYFDNKDVQASFERWHVERYGYPPREASYIEPQRERGA